MSRTHALMRVSAFIFCGALLASGLNQAVATSVSGSLTGASVSSVLAGAILSD